MLGDLIITLVFFYLALAIRKKIFRQDGIVGFFKWVCKRETGGQDLMLFGSMLAVLYVALVYVGITIGLYNLNSDLNLRMLALRPGLIALSVSMAVYFFNGRLSSRVRRIHLWIQQHLHR